MLCVYNAHLYPKSIARGNQFINLAGKLSLCLGEFLSSLQRVIQLKVASPRSGQPDACYLALFDPELSSRTNPSVGGPEFSQYGARLLWLFGSRICLIADKNRCCPRYRIAAPDAREAHELTGYRLILRGDRPERVCAASPQRLAEPPTYLRGHRAQSNFSYWFSTAGKRRVAGPMTR